MHFHVLLFYITCLEAIKVLRNFLARKILHREGFRIPPLVQLLGDGQMLVVADSWTELPEAKVSLNRDRLQIMEKYHFENYVIYRAHPKNDRNSGDLNLTCQSGKHTLIKRIKIPFSKEYQVLLFGDNQMGSKTFSKLLKQASRERFDLFVHVGDMVQQAGDPDQWYSQFFEPLLTANIIPAKPLLIAQGNHDVIEGKPSPYFSSFTKLESKNVGYYYARTIGDVR